MARGFELKTFTVDKPTTCADVPREALRHRGLRALCRPASSAQAVTRRELIIITLAARHKLPTVYSRRVFITDGALIAYGLDSSIYGRVRPATSIAALRGEKFADLPVQAPTK